MRNVRTTVLALASLFALSACDAGGLPQGWFETPEGSGPQIVWDLAAEPLPEVPLPNDVATWPDPGSPTGRRVNASMVAPTRLEERTRIYFDELDGWGTQAPISVRFDAPVNVEDLIARQGEDRFGADDWGQHAIYVVNLETGIPVPLDINGGFNQYALRDPNRYWENDYRAGESNIMFETVEEDLDGDGELDPGEDTDFDGVLDHPNTIDGLRRSDDPLDTYNRMLWFYERETNTMLLRPVIPLEEQTAYAVVITDRLQGRDGGSVRSPLPHVHHISQRDSLASLPDVFSSNPELYGELSSRGWEGVAFAWSFTTQSVTGDLNALREGIYGRGAFASLADDFPADVKLSPLWGRPPTGQVTCDPENNVYSVSYEALREILLTVGQEAFGNSLEEMEELLTSYSNVSHFVMAFYDTPYLLGDPNNDNVNERWQMNRQTGEARIGRDLVRMFITVPRESETHQQPFPVVFYGHGYTSSMIESIGFGGLMAQHGLSTVGIDAQGHGLGIDPLLKLAVEAIFSQRCLYGMSQALLTDRARDLNGDGVKDSAGIYWTSYVFHTRDVVRQSVLDHMQAIRILRNFGEGQGDGLRRYAPGTIAPLDGAADVQEFTGDLDGDGILDVAGDFDGDGRPDIGGWNNGYYAWGQSLGGILSALLAGAEPALTAAAPTAGAGGLIDVGVRSTQGGVREAVILRTMGPLVTSVVNTEGPSRNSSCQAGEHSFRFVVPDVNDTWTTEFACLADDELEPNDVVVVRNLSNRESRCAAADAESRLRIGIPSDTGDVLQVEIYVGGRDEMLYGESCTWIGERPELRGVITEFGVSTGDGEGQCERCALYRGRSWNVGDALVTPTEGYGLPRQTPDLRRFLALAQIALEPGDPGAYARGIFLDPVSAPDVRDGAGVRRNVLVMNTIGDMNVPISAGNAYARAAGVLPFMPMDAPDVFRDYRAPASFVDSHGYRSPHRMLVDNYVLEGVARLGRVPTAERDNFLFDVDDLGEGEQWFRADGGGQLAPGGDTPAYQAPRPAVPLRWVRASRPMTRPDDTLVWGLQAGQSYSGFLNAMVRPNGEHGFDAIDGSKVWDEGEYLANLIAWYFASQGRELLYRTNPSGHHCLEDSSCLYGQPPVMAP